MKKGTCVRKSHWGAGKCPPCFADYEQWLEWLALRKGAASPCVDCLPEYRLKMLRQGRCIRPETQFFRDEFGVFGVSADCHSFNQVLHGEAPRDAERLSDGLVGGYLFYRWLTQAKKWVNPRASASLRKWIAEYERQEREEGL